MASYYPKRGELWLSWYESGKRHQQAIIDPVTGLNLKDTRINRRYAKDVVLSKTLELKRPRTQRVNLNMAITIFLSQLTIKPKTRLDYEKRLFSFKEVAGASRQLETINPDDISKFDKFLREKRINRNKLPTPLSEVTISDYWRDIYSFFKYSKSRGWIESIPFERKRKVKKFRIVKQVIPVIMLKKLFDAVRSDIRDYKTLKLLLLTGLRPTEAVHLTWEQIDFDNNFMTIDNTKVNREDLFPLKGNKYSEAVRDFLWEFRSATGKVLDYDSTQSLRPLNKRLKKIIGSKYTLYDIRRTFCTNLLAEGADIYSVQKLMRHKDIKTTLEHYTFVEAIKIGLNLEKIHELYKEF